MKPNWDTQIAQLDQAMTVWRTLVTSIQPTFNTPQNGVMNTSDLTLALEGLLAALKVVNDSDGVDPIAWSVYQNSVESGVSVISSSVEGLRTAPHAAQQYLHQIVQHAWSIRSALPYLVPLSAKVDVNQALANFEVEAQQRAIRDLVSELSKAVAKSGQITKDIDDYQQRARDSADRVLTFERSSDTAKLNAEASATAAAASKESIASKLVELSEGLTVFASQQNAIEQLRAKAESTLEGASKIALAKSFVDRREKLEKGARLWVLAFALGIVLLFLTATGHVWTITLPALGTSGGTLNLEALIARLVLAGPIIWFTWFAVRQFGMTSRLREDYAFKEATALAFSGYQREMTEDEKMIRLLRELAIKNFGSSPMSMLGKTEPASPVHELLDKALEKAPLEKVIDLLKSVLPGR